MVNDNTIDELVDVKNELVTKLSDVLELLSAARVDMACDTKLREAVLAHPALDLRKK